jgi:hypothetical protein
MGDSIDFNMVTTEGVARQKQERKSDAMKEKVINQKEMADLKVTMGKTTATQDALKKRFLKESVERLSGGTGGEPAETEQEKISMIYKIEAYYKLPRHRGRQRLAITQKTTVEQLKAELYDLESGDNGQGAELIWFSIAAGCGVLENLSNKGNNFTGWNFDTLASQVNEPHVKEELYPVAQELAIKYSGLMPKGGVWSRFIFGLARVAMHVHRTNTDPEYVKMMEKMNDPEIAEQLSKLQQ